MIHSILITAHDNDFYSTFIGLLGSIKEALLYAGDELDQEKVRQAIKDGILWHYLVFQDGYAQEDGNRVERYLLDKLEVWFNEEADERTKMDPCDLNGEYYYLNIDHNILTSM